jgi:hypothetical protein
MLYMLCLCGLVVKSSWLQNGGVLCLLWGTIWIYICYVEESRPPLWSSGQSSLLQIQRSGFNSWVWNWVHSALWVQLRSYLEEKIVTPGLEIGITAVGIHHADYATTLYPQKLALTSLTSGGRSVSIVLSQTKATEFISLRKQLWTNFRYCLDICFYRQRKSMSHLSLDMKHYCLRQTDDIVW